MPLERLRLRRAWQAYLTVGLVVGVLSASGFIVGRWVLGLDSAEADPSVPADKAGSGPREVPPGPNETPVPGSTPDTTRPFWYVPYENQDRLTPKFHGTINGIEVGRASGPAPSCAGVSIKPDFDVVRGTAFQIQVSALPKGVSLSGPPRIAQCPDGRLIWLTFDLNVASGTAGANAGGGSITVWRWADVRWISQEAPAERWSAGVVAGRPAALLRPPLENIGQSAVVIADDQTRGSTTLLGGSVSLELLRQVAEALYR